MSYLLSPSQDGLLGTDVGIVEGLDDVRRVRKQILIVLGNELFDTVEQVALCLLVIQGESQQRRSVGLQLFLLEDVLRQQHVHQQERRLVL